MLQSWPLLWVAFQNRKTPGRWERSATETKPRKVLTLPEGSSAPGVRSAPPPPPPSTHRAHTLHPQATACKRGMSAGRSLASPRVPGFSGRSSQTSPGEAEEGHPSAAVSWQHRSREITVDPENMRELLSGETGDIQRTRWDKLRRVK